MLTRIAKLLVDSYLEGIHLETLVVVNIQD